MRAVRRGRIYERAIPAETLADKLKNRIIQREALGYEIRYEPGFGTCDALYYTRVNWSSFPVQVHDQRSKESRGVASVGDRGVACRSRIPDEGWAYLI
jgi:hypothetical protein